MRPVVLDLETFFGDDFTLSKMTTESYIRDPRFEAHGAAIKWDKNTSAQWYDQRELAYILKEEDWSDVFLIHHHAHFDGFILGHRYGVRPGMFGCTLSMARLMLGNHISVSLDSVRKHFGLPSKITPYNLFRGKHWSELSQPIRQQVAEGAIDEVESIWKIFGLLMQSGFPPAELDVIDSVVRMFTDPVLELDSAMLAKLWESEAARKINGAELLGVDGSELRSTELFCGLLTEMGIDIEYKDGKNGPIPAIARNDPFMRDFLREHEDERVRGLAEARLAEKSTLLQTRAATLGWVASRGPAPVYLHYSGAGTLRPSGGDGCNWLNFKRGSPIRRAVKAPQGFYLAPVDASQIECRVAHYVADPNNPILQKFRNNEDPYSATASEFYQEEIYNPKEGDPRYDELKAKRGMGKQGQLMCIYGASGKQFKATAAAGTYGPRVDMTLETANAFVETFRKNTPWICARNTGYWAQCERMLARLGGGDPIQWGPLWVENHRIYIQGAPMIYDTIEYHTPQPGDESDKTGWRVKKRDGWRFIWGSKLTQNICEGVSRMIVSQAMIRIKKKYGIRTLNWPYDELLLLIPRDGREEEMLQLCIAEMTVEPTWLPGIPLAAEGALGERYEK
jgi:DNA polymerase family A